MCKVIFLFLLIIPFINVYSNIESENLQNSTSLFKDLEIVEEVNQNLDDKLPLSFNYNLQGGYFTMPSARMADVGSVGLSFSMLSPYHVYNLSFQYFDRLELSGSYWIYRGILESGFGHLGYGDDADRAASVKVALLKNCDGYTHLPEISFGINDFMGSKRFYSKYIVATKQFLNMNLEASLGWGIGRIDGIFGGIAFSPFRKRNNPLKGLAFACEYDANDYKFNKYEHPKGRDVNSRINYGIKYKFLDLFDVNISSLRGKKLALSTSFHYNFGKSEGVFPKYLDPLPYKAPINQQVLGKIRSEKEFSNEINYAFLKQGLDVYKIVLNFDEKINKYLWIKIVNVRYLIENDVKERLINILSSILPNDISYVIVGVEAEGISLQQYYFRGDILRRYKDKNLGYLELDVLSPMKNISSEPKSINSHILFERKKRIWTYTLRPNFQTYFGSITGKFKYDLGLLTGLDGYLFDTILYSLKASYIASSSAVDMKDRDKYNPSQIINVRSDFIKYRKKNSLHIEEAYLQKSWNIRSGWFSRIALGYFEVAYAGVAGELLYYPIDSIWAVGFDIATLLKRNYSNMGFEHKIRKFHGEKAMFEKYFGLQYFLNINYNFQPLKLNLKASIGQFLAHDKGVKFELTRYFSNGFNISTWITFTNGHDVINNKKYYDKGFTISFPLEMFMNKSSRSFVKYSMSAWLRDVGQVAKTGREIYPILYQERAQ